MILKTYKSLHNSSKTSKSDQITPLKSPRGNSSIELAKKSIKAKKELNNLNKETVWKFYKSEYMRMEAVVEVTGG